VGYLVPGFAFLTVLAAVPVLIHLFGKPRAERRKFAALAFLMKSDRKTATRRKVREILLLVARASVIAAIPLILAKPYLEAAPERLGLPSGIGNGRAESAVIVVDDSRSMGYRVGERTLLDEAKARATKMVENLGRDSEVAILLTSGALPPQSELTPDRGILRRAIGNVRATHKPGDTTGALKRAAALLATAPQTERRVYLISDLASHGFPEISPPWGLGGPTLVPVDVTDGKTLPNRAVVEVKVEPAAQLGPHGLRVDAVVANFADEPQKDLAVTLRVDGKPVAKGLLDIPARGKATKRFFHLLEDPAAPADGQARAEAPHDLAVEIEPDALPDDDRRFARAQVRRELSVLVVDGDPRTIRRDDEAFFLETALRPGDRDDSRIEVAVSTVEDLARRRLDEFDVIFLANVKAPDPERAAALTSFVKKGGGLFLGMGDNVDADAWNAAFGELLPQPLAVVRTVGATAKARDDGEARVGGAGEKIARFDRRHAVLAPFGAGDGPVSRGAAEALRESRIARYLLLKPTARARDDEHAVLLRLEGGAPLLVEGKLGAGRVLLLTTSLDRDWSDLAIQPAYLPLVQQAARYLAGASLRTPDAASPIGRPHEIPLVDGTARIEVTAPSGALRGFDSDRVSGRKALSFTDTDEPGIYRVAATASGVAARPRPLPHAAFAINVEPEESDLSRVDPARLVALEPAQAKAKSVAPRRKIELWHGLGAALLALMLLEAALSARRRR
jgi:hypothetical protein